MPTPKSAGWPRTPKGKYDVQSQKSIPCTDGYSSARSHSRKTRETAEVTPTAVRDWGSSTILRISKPSRPALAMDTGHISTMPIPTQGPPGAR